MALKMSEEEQFQNAIAQSLAGTGAPITEEKELQRAIDLSMSDV